MRDSFVFYKYMYEAFKNFNDKEFREAVTAVMDYAFYGTIPDEKAGIGKTIYHLAKDKLDKGMKSLDAQNGRRTQEYIKWRDDVFERDDYTCQLCGARGVELNAHHIKPYSEYPELRTELSNGITLCKKCHKGVHHGK